MVRLFTFIGLLITFGWFFYALRSKSMGIRTVGLRFYEIVQDVVFSLGHLKSLSCKDFSNRLLYPLTLICTFVLALTSYLPTILLGKHMAGYLLILHVIMGPFFALCLITLSIVWAHKHRFDVNDWKTLKGLLSRKQRLQDDRSINLLLKVCFWLLVVLTLPILLSIISSMYKIFGSRAQEFLLQLHRYTTLLFVMITVIFTYYERFKEPQEVKKCQGK